MKPCFIFHAFAFAALLFAQCGEALGNERVGVVLVHGKQGTPEQFSAYDDLLSAEGYLVARPEMCWSRRRIYDRRYLDCLKDIDAAVEELKTRGATAFVVAGQSLGANAALAYGARILDSLV